MSQYNSEMCTKSVSGKIFSLKILFLLFKSFIYLCILCTDISLSAFISACQSRASDLIRLQL